MYKTPHVRTTFGSWDVEKVHAVVARSTFSSQNVQSTPDISKLKCTKHSFGALLEVEMSKKCALFWRQTHFQVNMYKTHHVQTTFASWNVQKVHAVVARSTCPSQKCKKLKGLDYFLTFRCRKSVRGCGAKHISKSKVSKTLGFGPLLDSQMSFCLACARDSAPCEQWAKCKTLLAVSTTTTKKVHYTTLDYIPLHSTPLHYTTLHYTTLRYTTLHYNTFNYATV